MEARQGLANAEASTSVQAKGGTPFDRLTPGEREALQAMRGKVTTMKRIGTFGGAGLAYYAIHLRSAKARYGLMTKIGVTILGGVIGGVAMMPVGVLWGSSDIRNKVEDRAHLEQIMAEIAQNRSRSSPQQQQSSPLPGMPESSAQRTSSDAGFSSQRFPSAQRPSPLPPSGSSPSSAKSNAWGDESFDDSVLYGSNGNGNSNTFDNAQPSSSTNAPSTLPSSSARDATQPQPQPQQNSRWAQLRNERAGTSNSSWDQLRERNAKEAYARRGVSQDGQGGQMTDKAGAGGYVEVADPTFGKGVSSQRAQAQREYEASFERERRGLNG